MNKSEFITQFSAKSGGIALDGSCWENTNTQFPSLGQYKQLPPIKALTGKVESQAGLGWNEPSNTQLHLQGHLPPLQAAPNSTQFCFKCQLKRHGAVNHQTTCKKFISLPNHLQKSSFISLGSWGNQASFHPSNCSCMQLPPSAFAPRTKLAHKKLSLNLQRFGLSQGINCTGFSCKLKV